MLDIVQSFHARAHDGRGRLEQKLKMFYHYNGGVRDCVQEVFGGCARCKEFSQKIGKGVQAIITNRPYELIMFDLTKLPMATGDGFVWLLLVKDHFTKYHWGCPLKDKTPEAIVDFLVKTFTNCPVPERWHCDNGGEFVNDYMHRAMEKLHVHGSHGRPRHPQTQGLIERANYTIKTKVHLFYFVCVFIYRNYHTNNFVCRIIVVIKLSRQKLCKSNYSRDKIITDKTSYIKFQSC